jgi:hypothetical protein
MSRQDGPPDTERRSFVRAQLAGTIEGDIDLELPSDVLYLSDAGMMMRLPFDAPIGSRHRFTIEVDGRAIQVEGIVRNTQEDPAHPAKHRAGIEFEGLPDDDRLYLEAFVARKLKQAQP